MPSRTRINLSLPATSKSRRTGGPGLRERSHRHLHDPTLTRDRLLDARSENDLPVSTEPDDQVLTRLGPTWAVSILLGATTGLLVVGVIQSFDRLFATGAIGTGSVAVIGVALLAIGFGVRIPQQFALLICLRVWRRWPNRNGSLDLSGVLLRGVDADRPLYWIILAIIALIAGISSALLPLQFRASAAAYHWMTDHFLWSTVTLTILQIITLVLTLAWPLTILGLSVSCVHHLCCPHGRWETRATGYLLVGTGAGVLLANQLTLLGARIEMVLAIGAIPALLTALIAGCSRASRKPSTSQGLSEERALRPSFEDRWPRLLRLSIVTIAGASACATTLWCRSVQIHASQSYLLVALVLVAMGVGVLAGCHPRLASGRTIGGFGVACMASGTLVALSLGLMRFWQSGLQSALLSCTISVCAIGYAMAYGRQALLSRVGCRSLEGATIVAQSLVCASLTVWLGVPLVEDWMGTEATRVLLALSLLALGGILVIFEPGDSTRTRRLRLAAAFVPIATMISLSLLVPNWWVMP